MRGAPRGCPAYGSQNDTEKNFLIPSSATCPRSGRATAAAGLIEQAGCGS